MKRIFCLLFVLFICRISCETLYIANNGTGAACSKESPCTVSEINTHIINPGDVLQFGCGVFEGLNVSNATIRGDDSGCTVFTTSTSTYCMQIDGVTTVAGIKFTNCTNSFGATNQLNLILANSTFTSSPIKLSGNLIRIEMQNVSSDKEIVLVNQNYASLYFYIFSTKASFVNITSLTNITKGSTISNLQVGKSATSDPLSITSNYIGEANHPVAIKNLKVIKAITNGLRIRAEYVANVMLINSYIQSAGSRSISAIANQGQLIFSIRNTQFYSSGSFDFISNSAAINKTTLAVKVDTSSFSYINTNTSLLNLQGTSVEFKTCSSSYTNNLLPSTVISIEDSTINSNSALKGFISNSVFSNNAGNYVTFAKSSIDSKFLICGNTFVGGPSAKRALLVTSSKYRAAQNNNFFDDNFSNSVIEVVSSSVQLNFTTTIFNGTSPNFVTSTKDGSVIELNFDNSLINPRTYVATNCLNVNSSVSTVSLTNTTFRNCDSIVLNSGSSNFTMQGNSSIYTVGYYQTNFKCLNAASISFLTVAKNNTQTCFNQLKPNNCLNANVTTASCSETTFTSRFNSSFIQPCQKGPCACYWQGDCSCNVTTPPAITVQTVAYCSQGTYYIYDPYPIFLPTATYSLQDSLSFTGPVWIKNTTKFVLTYNGTYYPTISSEDFVNVTGSLTLNITARPPDVDSKNKKKTLLVIKSNKKLNGTLLTITAPNNYTISGKCDKTSVKPVYGNNQVSLNLTLSLNTSCSDIMSDGAVAGIMIAIIIAIIFGVFVSHKLENWNKK